MSKKVKFIISVISNLVMACMVTLIFISCFSETNNSTIKHTGNSEYKGTVFAGDKQTKNVSLMINVYWGNEYLDSMLKTLDKYNVKTTFFVGGTWAKENCETLKRIYSAGHEIGNHGYAHKEHGKLDYTKNLTEIQTCHEIVKDILGIDMELFAPPGGSYNSSTTKAAEFLNYKTIMWTRDTIDWRDKDTKLIYNRAVTGMCGGDLILMHPTKNTAEALDDILAYIKSHNFTAVPVSKTLSF